MPPLAAEAGAAQTPPRNVVLGHSLSPWPQPWLYSVLGSTQMDPLRMPASGNFMMWPPCPRGFGHMLFVFKSTEKSAVVATPLHNR